MFVSLFSYGQDGSNVYYEYYASGNIKMKAYMENGVKNGPLITYSEDGYVRELYSYKNGKFHGTFKTWDDNNMIAAIASYKEGKKDGTWKIYKEGKLLYKLEYSNGVRINAEKLE